ncbi:MAG: dCTP deaminase [Promethearchaeota archaeon]
MVEKGSILSDIEIKERLEWPLDDWEKKLIIAPILDLESQLGQNSIDLRIGTEFSLPKPIKISTINPLNEAHNIKKYEQKIHLNYNDKYIIHPSHFVLGITLEYIKIPDDLIAFIEGRSSWGRLGLEIHATANFVEPGFLGTLTLELKNTGLIPLELKPGLRIAQLILMKTSKKSKRKYSSTSKKYFGSTSPSFSKIFDDKDNKTIKNW